MITNICFFLLLLEHLEPATPDWRPLYLLNAGRIIQLLSNSRNSTFPPLKKTCCSDVTINVWCTARMFNIDVTALNRKTSRVLVPYLGRGWLLEYKLLNTTSSRSPFPLYRVFKSLKVVQFSRTCALTHQIFLPICVLDLSQLANGESLLQRDKLTQGSTNMRYLFPHHYITVTCGWINIPQWSIMSWLVTVSINGMNDISSLVADTCSFL